MIAEVLEDHPTAHNVLAMAYAAPPLPGLPALLRPLWLPPRSTATPLNRLLLVGTLPPAAREKLGLRCSAWDERQFRAVGRTLGRANASLPEQLKYISLAYHARRAAQAQQRLEHALNHRPL